MNEDGQELKDMWLITVRAFWERNGNEGEMGGANMALCSALLAIKPYKKTDESEHTYRQTEMLQRVYPDRGGTGSGADGAADRRCVRGGAVVPFRWLVKSPRINNTR